MMYVLPTVLAVNHIKMIIEIKSWSGAHRAACRPGAKFLEYKNIECTCNAGIERPIKATLLTCLVASLLCFNPSGGCDWWVL